MIVNFESLARFYVIGGCASSDTLDSKSHIDQSLDNTYLSSDFSRPSNLEMGRKLSMQEVNVRVRKSSAIDGAFNKN